MIDLHLTGKLQRRKLSPYLGVEVIPRLLRPLLQLSKIADAIEASLNVFLEIPRKLVRYAPATTGQLIALLNLAIAVTFPSL